MLAFSILGGLVLLIGGAEGLVRGSSALARRLGVPPLVIGLTIVAFGTSTPELVVSLGAALDVMGGLAVGNVVGSNIFNIAFILGLSATIRPLKVELRVVRFGMPVLLAASFLLLFVLWNGGISRPEGAILALGLVLYSWAAVGAEKRTPARDGGGEPLEGLPGTPGKIAPSLTFIAAGLIALVLGSHLFVEGAVALARVWGVSEAVIGLTLVAAGTSLPELATSVVAAARGETDIAIGNVVGSNIFNILGILGLAGVVSPLTSSGIGPNDKLAMIVTALVLLPFLRTGFTLTRAEGLVLIGLYGGYLYVLWP